jgi:hypothetical protein
VGRLGLRPMWLLVVLGCLTMVLSVPLVLSVVPPNPFYGIRLPILIENETLWYKVNRRGGAVLFVMGLLWCLVGLLPAMSSWEPEPKVAFVLATVFPVASCIAFLIAIVIWVGRSL